MRIAYLYARDPVTGDLIPHATPDSVVVFRGLRGHAAFVAAVAAHVASLPPGNPFVGYTYQRGATGRAVVIPASQAHRLTPLP
jgi:hypothetical protein